VASCLEDRGVVNLIQDRRLEAASDRLQALVQAVKTVRPTLGAFYASLGDEQKARFNNMGQQK
jgi:aminopeptidase-like protein